MTKSWMYVFAIVCIIALFFLFKHFGNGLYLNFKSYLENKNIKKVVNSQSMMNFISLVLAILSIGVTLDNDIRENLINFSEQYIIIIIIFSLIGFIILLNNISSKNDEIKSLQIDLRSETKELWKSYSDLDKFYKEKNLKNFIKVFLGNNPGMISIQQYYYTIYNHHDCLRITIWGENKVVREFADLNTISQGHFSFDHSDLKELLKAYSDSRKSLSSKDLSSDNYTPMGELFSTWANELSRKEPDNYEDSDSIRYQLLLILVDLLNTGLSINLTIPLKNEQLARLKGRKSGIEIARFLLIYYIKIHSNPDSFSYQGLSDSKKNRIYSNIQVENPEGENVVFVLTHDGNAEYSDPITVERITQTNEKFIELLQENS